MPNPMVSPDGRPWVIAAPDVPEGKRAIPNPELAHYPRLRGEHPRRWQYPSYLVNDAVPWLRSLRELYENPLAFPASLSPEAGLMLHGLVRNARPRVAVEVGTFVSVSTHWIASALKENGEGATLHCFDDFGPIKKGAWRDAEMLSGREEWVKDRLDRAGLLSLCRLYPGNSPHKLKEQRDAFHAMGGVDLAFIDGDHGVYGAVQDFWAIEPVLNTGGYVVFHDIFPDQCGGHNGPREILDRINEISAGLYEKLELYLSPLNYGMGVLRRVG
ncbi:MAG: class I SAM-dependent methyltransferase [Phycisphaeraceae bacterium]|nr:class I SAM-dependent methyltransferase [Phycisphaeraceae bacterium]MBX3368190.1 class I SAM-dependent methyltransferase [Phycisphaeraceae bacterium]